MDEWFTAPDPARRVRVISKGYAGQPGSGPEGKTCGECAHLVTLQFPTRRVFKCSYTKSASERTDIRKKTAACWRWEEAGR